MTRELHRLRGLLCELQTQLRDAVVAARERQAGRFARIAGVTAADTIYHVDRIGEAAIVAWFERRWPRTQPVELVMEGLEGDAVTFPRGTPPARTKWKVIIDPIDGTRGLMYDKRSAWVLAALAPQRGSRNDLRDLVVAAMSEVPTSKQTRVDQLSAVRGAGVVAERFDLGTGERRRWRPRPSQAREFGHGFAAFARFFPEGKVLLAQIEEEVWRELGVLRKADADPVFDDQYISTGGQLFELIAGHDRMLADLRPPVYAKLGYAPASLCCHPYDICTALIAREAGCVVEAPDGGELRAPLDTTSAVSWVAYANPILARKVRPILRRVLRRLT